jgi:hypothetical protein
VLIYFGSILRVKLLLGIDGEKSIMTLSAKSIQTVSVPRILADRRTLIASLGYRYCSWISDPRGFRG